MKDQDYYYYSKKLKTTFDSLEELRVAEKEAETILKVVEKAKEEKKDLAKKVSDAYANYIKVGKEANKKIIEARNNYYAIRDECIEKYGSYHMTYTNSDGKETCEIDGLLSDNLFHNADNFITLVNKFLSF